MSHFLARLIVVAVLVMSPAGLAQGDIIEFFATGLAGNGLLGGNVAGGSQNPGSGGIGATGITIDTDNNVLHVDIAWGSENGFTDMSGEVTMLHLHGPTASRGPDNFDEVTSDIVINLGNSLRFNPSASGGGLNDNFFISNDDIALMREGRFYLNVHTELNPMGETRGYLLETVPEPGTGLVLAAIGGVAWSRRRRRSILESKQITLG